MIWGTLNVNRPPLASANVKSVSEGPPVGASSHESERHTNLTSIAITFPARLTVSEYRLPAA